MSNNQHFTDINSIK